MKVQINSLIAGSNVGEKKDRMGNVRTYVDIYDRDNRAMVNISISDEKPFKVEDGSMGILSGDMRFVQYEGRSFLTLKNPNWQASKP